MKTRLIFSIILCLLPLLHLHAQLIPVIIDTDANNELDDQHALAYAFFNSDVFDIAGITVNHTAVGTIQNDYDEARRVMRLCTAWDKIPLKQGAGEGTYANLVGQLDDPDFEGHEAVDFIIKQAHVQRNEQLILAPIGKLTNIALALEKDPLIVPKVKVVWLGGNYTGQNGHDGEHNLRHDTEAYNAIIETGVEFEMVTVRYGQPSGTDAVAVHVDEIQAMMPGKGPATSPVTGRHGGIFTSFGDYSVSLFTNYTTGTRPLFDMVLFAVLKNPEWAESSVIPTPRLSGGNWDGVFPDKTITLYENFNKDAILADFFETMDNPVLPDEVTVVDKLISKEISIHQNPNSILTIELNRTAAYSYILANSDGKSVMSGTINQKRLNLDISKLSRGIYFLRIGNTSFKIYAQAVKGVLQSTH